MLLHHGRLKHSAGVKVSDNHFSFIGPSTSALMIEEPLSPILNYFELEIVNSGESCSIGIGCGENNYPLSRMPGWNVNGIGYHADDGRLYHQRGFGSDFGPKCVQSDRMGCGLEFSGGDDSVWVFFTRNGEKVGHKVRMKRPIHGLYPVIGLHSQNESVRYLGHYALDSATLCPLMDIVGSPADVWMRANNVNFLEDSLTLEYTGKGCDVQDVAMAQSKYRVGLTNHYFEMTILSVGSRGALAIGLAKSTYSMTVHPGWEDDSIAYHADDGKLFTGHGTGDPFGPSCTDGDIMGCGIEIQDGEDFEPDLEESEEDTEEIQQSIVVPNRIRILGRPRVRGLARLRNKVVKSGATRNASGVTANVYFTKNGEVVGEREVSVPKGGFYPVVAMLSKGEKLRVNFNPLSG